MRVKTVRFFVEQIHMWPHMVHVHVHVVHIHDIRMVYNIYICHIYYIHVMYVSYCTVSRITGGTCTHTCTAVLQIFEEVNNLNEGKFSISKNITL